MMTPVGGATEVCSMRHAAAAATTWNAPGLLVVCSQALPLLLSDCARNRIESARPKPHFSMSPGASIRLQCSLYVLDCNSMLTLYRSVVAFFMLTFPRGPDRTGLAVTSTRHVRAIENNAAGIIGARQRSSAARPRRR